MAGEVTGVEVPCHDGPPRVVAAVGLARRMRLVRPRPLVDTVTSAWESWRKDIASEAFRQRY